MNSSNLSWIALAIAAGIGIPVMARLNATLAQSVGSTGWAALLLFGVAFAGTALFLAATRQPFPAGWGSAHLPTFGAGLLVTFYLLSVTFLIPRIGVAPTILAVVTGQILASLAIDHFGLLQNVMRPLDLVRATGIALMLIGLALALRPAST